MTGKYLIEKLEKYRDNTLLSKKEKEAINKGLASLNIDSDYMKDDDGNWIEIDENGDIKIVKDIKFI